MPVVDDAQSPFDAFEQLPWSTWDEANLVPVVKYLLGNKYLLAPPEWRASFPTAIQLLHRVEEQRNATRVGFSCS